MANFSIKEFKKMCGMFNYLKTCSKQEEVEKWFAMTEEEQLSWLDKYPAPEPLTIDKRIYNDVLKWLDDESV